MINDYSPVTLSLMINPWQTFSNNLEGFENMQVYLLLILCTSVSQNGFLNAAI